MASVVESLPQRLVSHSQSQKSADISVVTDWEMQAEKCRAVLRKSLNPAWLLPPGQLPPADQLNVSTFIETCGFLSARELEITATSATNLVEQMASGSLTAVETVTAFLKRAHIAHQLTNFATEFMNADALEDAAELDAHFKATGKIKGPLHGIPISTKEHIEHKGRIAHSAYVALIDNVAEEDALIVQCCKKAGAIFHVRTNEPQSVMHIDCSNPIYGTTVNPHNRTLTCGGSSGGEGASLGLRCAALGIGTDLGGSVRVPAAFCGAYGLRTTALRNPYKGVCLPGAGQQSIRCVISPLANTAEDLGLFQKAVLDQEPWEIETSLVPQPWKHASSLKPGSFTIGVMWEDGLVRPHPPVIRALRYAVEKLRTAGITVLDFEPYNHQEGMDTVSRLYFPECAVTQKELLEKGGEPIAPLSDYIFNFSPPRPLTIQENWAFNVKRDTLREQYHKIMKDRGVDFILCPAYVGPAAKLGDGHYIPYTAIWNLLDQPAVAFPTGLKVELTDTPYSDFKPRSAEEEREYNKYSPEEYAEAPLALQIVDTHENITAFLIMPDAKLRAKTGCAICRQRRVKCDEAKPSCRNCSRFGRSCSWPKPADMADRRHRRRRASPAPSLSSSDRPSPPKTDETSHDTAPILTNRTTLTTVHHPLFETEIEFELMHHFYNFHFDSLTLPTKDKSYFFQCQSDLMDMMTHSRSVKYAILANCASNKHVLMSNDRYRLIALRYYTEAMRGLNQELEDFCPSDTYRHSCLSTVASFLYVYDFWNLDIMSDPRPHVVGAVKLLSLKNQDNSSLRTAIQSYDRVNIESVLYQGFLLSIRRPFRPDFRLDTNFITHAEDLLRSYDNANPSFAEPSIILGVPTSLYRLILRIIDSSNVPRSNLSDHLQGLKVELQYWEQLLFDDENSEKGQHGDSRFNDLIIIATSLLFDLITETLASNDDTIYLVSSAREWDGKPWRWQLDLATNILQCPEEHQKWSGCYLGAWPLLILGYGARSLEEITLVKDVLRKMQERIGYGEVQRIRDELDEITTYKSSQVWVY
ncbi:general amidase [Fusarium sp. NRRL 25303]|nr:general amidase [Fusarium sp. NRRL 25303]